MALPGTLFSYLAAFITIILAIAVGDMAMSLHRLLRARRRVKWRALPLLAATWVLLAILTSFFEIWELTKLDHISFARLVWLFAPQLFYFLAASAVLPDDVPPEGLDLNDHYYAERGYLYTVLAIGLTLNTLDGVTRDNFRMLTEAQFLWTYYLPLNVVVLALFVTLARSARPWVHWLGLAALFASASFGFTGWEVKAPSAVTAAPPAAEAPQTAAPAPAK